MSARRILWSPGRAIPGIDNPLSKTRRYLAGAEGSSLAILQGNTFSGAEVEAASRNCRGDPNLQKCHPMELHPLGTRRDANVGADPLGASAISSTTVRNL